MSICIKIKKKKNISFRYISNCLNKPRQSDAPCVLYQSDLSHLYRVLPVEKILRKKNVDEIYNATNFKIIGFLLVLHFSPRFTIEVYDEIR